jgi:STIP1 family protein 1
MLLRAKKALWEARETARLHEMDETLKSLEELINADLARAEAELKSQLEKKEIGEVGYREDLSALREDAQKKIQHVREAFRISSKGDIEERVSIFRFLEHVHGWDIANSVSGCA